jgi:hypothetical protein
MKVSVEEKKQQVSAAVSSLENLRESAEEVRRF